MFDWYRWFTGFFLLILMLVALFANSVIFSARSFQHHLAQVDPSSGGIVSIEELQKVEARVAEIERKTAPFVGDAADLDAQIATLARDIANARDGIADAQARLANTVVDLERRTGITPVDMEFDPADIAQRLERIAAQRTATQEIKSAVLTARAELTRIGEAADAVVPKERDLTSLENQAKAVAEAVNMSRRQVLGLKGQFGDNFERIRNEAYALKASSPLGLGASLVKMHPTFLSTVLVCIMGGLGALLYLFPAYLKPENKIGMQLVVVRLVFGMVTALGFYIVANATLAGFAFVPGENGSNVSAASLNPFTVSLLGIIAGIMADDIAEWIYKRGRDFLGGGLVGERPANPTLPANEAPPRGSGSGPATAATTAPYEGGVNPHGGPVGLLSDPLTAAAEDARRSARFGDAGDTPPPGGVVG